MLRAGWKGTEVFSIEREGFEDARRALENWAKPIVRCLELLDEVAHLAKTTSSRLSGP